MDAFYFIFLIIILVSIFQLHNKLNRIEKKLHDFNVKPEKMPEIPHHLKAEPANITAPLPYDTTQKNSKPEQKSNPENQNWKKFKRWLCYGSAGKDVSNEYAAATTWLTRLGIIILLCAVGFFLKYSIENNLVSPTVRIICTFLAGIGMFTAGLYGLRKRFHILAIGILSAGVITLYMGAFAGFKLYSVLPVEAAFVLMVLTTIVSMLTAVKKNILPVALTGCTGAYLTPVMLSNSSGNLPFLLTYIAIISAGLLTAARVYRWRSLEITAFWMSFILIAAGLARNYDQSSLVCIIMLFINFIIFSSIPLIRKKDSAIGLEECLLPVGSSAFTLLLGVAMTVQYVPSEYENMAAAIFALLLTAVNLTIGIMLKKRRPDGVKMLPAFLASAVFSLALSIPLAVMTSGVMACGWSLLGFGLVLIYKHSRFKTLLILSSLTFAAAFLAVVNFPFFEFIYDGMKERFFHGGVFAAALLASGFTLRRSKENKPAQRMCKAFFVSGGISMLVYTSIEVFLNLKHNEITYEFRHGGLSVWWAVTAVGLLIAGIRKNYKVLRVSSMLLFIGCLFKVYAIDISQLNTLHKVIAFLIIALLFLGGATCYIICRKRFPEDTK